MKINPTKLADALDEMEKHMMRSIKEKLADARERLGIHIDPSRSCADLASYAPRKKWTLSDNELSALRNGQADGMLQGWEATEIIFIRNMVKNLMNQTGSRKGEADSAEVARARVDLEAKNTALKEMLLWAMNYIDECDKILLDHDIYPEIIRGNYHLEAKAKAWEALK